MFVYQDDFEILETWISISSFNYFRVVSIEKQIHLFVFWEKFYWPLVLAFTLFSKSHDFYFWDGSTNCILKSHDFSKISASSNFTLFLMKSYWVKSIACVPSCGRSFCKLIYKKLLTLTKTCGSFRKNYDQNATSMHILSQFKVWMTLMPLNEFRVSQWSPKSFWSWS